MYNNILIHSFIRPLIQILIIYSFIHSIIYQFIKIVLINYY